MQYTVGYNNEYHSLAQPESMHGLGVLVFPKKCSFLLQGMIKSMATKDGREKHVQHQHTFTNGTPPPLQKNKTKANKGAKTTKQ